MNPALKEQLDLIPTTELVKALSARYDSLVIVAEGSLGPVGPRKRRMNWRGDIHVCLGMLAQASYEISKAADEEPEITTEDTPAGEGT